MRIWGSDEKTEVVSVWGTDDALSWSLQLNTGTYYAQVGAVNGDYVTYSQLNKFTVDASRISNGNLNGDTNITLTDLIPLQKHLLLRTNLTTEQSSLADLNSDGMINVIDLMLLKRTLLNP